ncbi:Chaperone protein DnaJ, partial [Dissostichus eleginoides]
MQELSPTSRMVVLNEVTLLDSDMAIYKCHLTCRNLAHFHYPQCAKTILRRGDMEEHFYDHQSASGYLAWRLKTVQRNSAQEIEKSKVSFQGGPKTHRSMHSPVRQLSGDECNEAMSVMRHSSDITLVQDKMKATFQQRQKVFQDRATASTVLDLFPRFLDTSGLIEQDFTMLFGEEVSGKFLAKWPTFFKPRIIADCKNLPGRLHVDELLLSAQQESDDGVWDYEVAAILLLLHLLPPTSKGKKSRVKISAKDATGRLAKFLRIDMPALRKWWCVMLMENFDLGSHGKMFAHWTETSKALLRGEGPPVFRVRKLDDITE